MVKTLNPVSERLDEPLTFLSKVARHRGPHNNISRAHRRSSAEESVKAHYVRHRWVTVSS